MTGDALREAKASPPWWIGRNSRWGYGILAQSRHGTQPGKFPGILDELLLMADHSRSLPVADPFDREPLISCGGALFSLRVAFARCGVSVEITPFPQVADSDLRARISFPCGGRSTAELNELFGATRPLPLMVNLGRGATAPHAPRRSLKDVLS